MVNLPCIYICEFCLKYRKSRKCLERHLVSVNYLVFHDKENGDLSQFHLFGRQSARCDTRRATRYTARTASRSSKSTGARTRFTRRTCACWPSCFLTTRRSTTTRTHSSSTSWRTLTTGASTSSATSAKRRSPQRTTTWLASSPCPPTSARATANSS